MSTFFEIRINPAHCGFGEYYCSAIEWEGWANRQDLLEECLGNSSGAIYELGVDALPADIDNICGRIHDEPEWVYAHRDAEGAVQYFGVCELPVATHGGRHDFLHH